MACNACGWNLNAFDLSAGFSSMSADVENCSEIARILLWKGALGMRSSVDFWNFLISLRAAFPGLALLFFTYSLTPVVIGAAFLEIFL